MATKFIFLFALALGNGNCLDSENVFDSDAATCENGACESKKGNAMLQASRVVKHTAKDKAQEDLKREHALGLLKKRERVKKRERNVGLIDAKENTSSSGVDPCENGGACFDSCYNKVGRPLRDCSEVCEICQSYFLPDEVCDAHDVQMNFCMWYADPDDPYGWADEHTCETQRNRWACSKFWSDASSGWCTYFKKCTWEAGKCVEDNNNDEHSCYYR